LEEIRNLTGLLGQNIYLTSYIYRFKNTLFLILYCRGNPLWLPFVVINLNPILFMKNIFTRILLPFLLSDNEAVRPTHRFFLDGK